MTERRRFLAKAGGVMAAAATAAIVDVPHVIAQPKVQWRMSTSYGAALDMLQGAANKLAKVVDETSGGRFKIEVFPAGQIMGPFENFDAASQGKIEAFMGFPSFWASKEPAFEWFATIPFGMNPEGMYAWFHQGDGLKLYEEAYAPFGLVPRPGPAVAPQMAGWFRKKINTIADYKGFKIRIAGLGGKVYTKAGATAVLTPGSEVYAALERGVIDACEWMGPYEDMKMNLHQTARYYYYPGWHEPGSTLVFGFNKKAYEALPVDLQRTLDHAVTVTQVYGLTDFHARNAIYLEKLKMEFKGKVEVTQIPVPVLRDLKKLSVEVIREESEKTPMAKKVSESFAKYQALVGPWDLVAEGAYHRLVAM
jgi:TRAP-type mannitol/chloroaromatic compound transport system substrate-binding protein